MPGSALGARRPFYPDAVTVTDDVSVDALLSRIDRSAGCSIKDSFSTLDVTAAGFNVLFDAQWIWRAQAPRPAGGWLRWERVERPDDLRAWSLEHRSTFSPALLDETSVTILAGRDGGGRLAAGAVATEADEAVGISNVFAVGDEDEGAASAFADAFAGATGAIVERLPGRPIVGYLSTDDLAAARAAGFEAIGQLRVWLLSEDEAMTTHDGSFLRDDFGVILASTGGGLRSHDAATGPPPTSPRSGP